MPFSDLRLSQKLALNDVIAAVKDLGAAPSACLDSGAQKVLRVAASAFCEPEVGVGDVVPLCSSHCPCLLRARLVWISWW